MNGGQLRRRRGRDLERWLTLLRVFLLASALICAGAGVVLGSILSRSLKNEALNAEETALAHYVDGVVHPLLVRHGRFHIPWQKDLQLAQNVLGQHDIATVKVWRRNGVLAWTNTVARASSGRFVANRDRRLVGRRFSLDGELNEAMEKTGRSPRSSAPAAGPGRIRSSATTSATTSCSRSTRRSTRTEARAWSGPTRSTPIRGRSAG